MRSIQSNSISKKNWPTFSQHVVAIQSESFPNTLEDLKAIADQICEKLNLDVVEKMHHPFDPQGETLVYVLSQSHLAIHSWPEFKVLHFDLVSCVEIKREDFAKVLQSYFELENSYYEWL